MTERPAHDEDTTVEPAVQRQIDRYRIERLLGGGGFGSVFAARHVHTGQEVALKLLKPELALDETQLKRFEREARAAARIRHPNVVHIQDWGTLPKGGAFLVMERMHGRTLGAELDERGALPIDEAVDIAAQLLDALDATHTAGVIHRDIKPSNVFLDERDGRCHVTLLDFGVSHLAATGSHTEPAPLTAPGTAIGSPGYMPPEQARGETVDERADLFAVCVLLYAMLAGTHPFEADSLAERRRRMDEEGAESLQARRPELSAAIAQAVHRGLAPVPSDRWQSARQLREALIAASDATLASDANNDPGPSAAVPQRSTPEPAPAGPDTERSPKASVAPPPPSRVRSARLQLAAAAVVAAGLLAVAAAVYLRGGADSERPVQPPATTTASAATQLVGQPAMPTVTASVTAAASQSAPRASTTATVPAPAVPPSSPVPQARRGGGTPCQQFSDCPWVRCDCEHDRFTRQECIGGRCAVAQDICAAGCTERQAGRWVPQ